MKLIRNYFLILFVFCSCITFSFAQSNQASIDTLAIYKNAKKAPFFVSLDPVSLSKYLTRTYNDEPSKVLAISYWICKNIEYNYSGSVNQDFLPKSTKKILRRGKALNNEYAMLFIEMLKAANIKAEYIPGYIKEFDSMIGDTLYKTNHAWVLVKINNSWQIMDIMQASGKLKMEASLYSKILWALFRVPYSMDIKAVQEYNPRYLYMKPNKSIFTHLPALSMFQMLEYPIPVETFQMGDTMIHQRVDRYPQVKRTVRDIEEYSLLSPYDKYIYLGTNSFDQNSNNHRIIAFYYFYATEYFKQEKYIEEKGRIHAPVDQVKKAYKYAVIADSMFNKSLDDNNNEFKTKSERSEKWKKDLMDYNKLLSQKFQERIKQNNKDIQLVSKLNKQNANLQGFISSNVGKFNPQEIRSIQRPANQRKADLEMAQLLLRQADTMQKKCDAILKKYHGIVAQISKEKTEQAVKVESDAKILHEKNERILTNYINKKGSNMSLVYYSNKYIVKYTFFNNFNKADSINKEHADTVFSYLAYNQVYMLELMKEYVSLTDQKLKNLKEAKRKLKEDSNEDAKFIKTISDFDEHFNKMSQQFADAIVSIELISPILREENESLEESISLLRRDIKLEAYRHKEYMDYIKSTKQAETDKIKYYQALLREHKKLIEKALK